MKSPKEWMRQVNDLSRPARALWIEIRIATAKMISIIPVEAREGLVD